MLKVTKTKASHVEELSRTMRECDKIEIWKANNEAPQDALLAGFLHGDCKTLLGEKVVAIYGHLNMGKTAYPWLLGSDLVDIHPKSFLQHTRKYVHHLQGKYEYLINYVYAGNQKSIRWLRKLGFTIHSKEPYGLEQDYFHKFDWRKHV